MRDCRRIFILAALALGGTVCPLTAANWDVDVESGYVNSGYNVVRVPGDTGTEFSLSNALDVRPRTFLRARVFYQFNVEHGMGVLYAPLELRAKGRAPISIDFAGETFPEGTELDALYRFNSYRLTYRYRFWKISTAQAHIGVSAKIRDAEIRVDGGGRSATTTNVGFVPLLYVRLDWKFSHPWGLLLEADALAAPQGRAEDVLLAFTYQANDHWRLKTGYRMVEGGADNATVYNFALIHYAVIGVTAEY